MLVEALAALAVTAIAAAGLIAALVSARDRAHEASVRDLALRQARHLLAESAAAGVGVERGELLDGRLAWTRTIAPYEASEGLQSVVVEVHWATRRREGTTRLETIEFSSG